MKISITKIKEAPKLYHADAYCVHKSQVDEEFSAWLAYHKFEYWSDIANQYLNFTIPDGFNLSECFFPAEDFLFVDGFSPNLNKHLHLGHLSNFILAKSFQSMGIGEKYIAHLGDTLPDGIPKMDAFKAFAELCLEWGYRVDYIYFASNMILNENKAPSLICGTGDYEGTKVFNLVKNDEKVVGVKSDGSTTYFYQDVALAQNLDSKTLYMTGAEQAGHFKNLEWFFPKIKHVPLGLVTLDGKKMSSRDGNVIWLTDVMNIMKEKFGNNDNLIWNVLCGYILKSNTDSGKDISVKDLDNVKSSFGLYLSYTLAKLNSAGLLFYKNNNFHTMPVAFAAYKAKVLMEPNILLKELVNTAKKLSGLYENHKIKDHPENHYLFKPLAEDLLTGMLLLGMKDVYKV